MKAWLEVWLIVVLGAITFAAAPAFGGIAVLDQQRSLLIRGHYDGPSPPGPPAQDGFDQMLAADPFSPFDRSLQGTDLANGYGAKTSAQQTSSLTANAASLHLVASGRIDGDSSDGESSAVAVSFYYVVFKLDTPASYTLTEQAEYGGVTGIDVSDNGAVLLNGAAQSNFGPFFPFPTNSMIPPVITLVGIGGSGQATHTGQLAPGTYTFGGGADATLESAGATGTYQIDFTLKALPVAVPLPPAFWPALCVLGTIAGASGFRRRTARRV